MTIPIGKYMHAEHLGCESHEVYTIHAKDGSSLGYAELYPRWRGYVFSPESGAVFSHDCCLELSRFLENCNNAERITRRTQVRCLMCNGVGSYVSLPGDVITPCPYCSEKHSTRLTAEPVDSGSNDSALPPSPADHPPHHNSPQQ